MTREESQAQTRERLIDAARVAVIREGYSGASVRKISEAAGFSLGAFYSNFASKEAILLDVLRRHKRHEIETITAIMDDCRDEPRKLLAAMETWAMACDADGGWAVLAVELQLQANRSPTFAKEFNALRAEHRLKIGELLERTFVMLGKTPSAPPAVLAGGFMALAGGLALERMSGGSDSAGATLLIFLKALVDSAPAKKKRT